MGKGMQGPGALPGSKDEKNEAEKETQAVSKPEPQGFRPGLRGWIKMNSVDMKVLFLASDSSVFKSELHCRQGVCCGAWELSSPRSA